MLSASYALYCGVWSQGDEYDYENKLDIDINIEYRYVNEIAGGSDVLLRGDQIKRKNLNNILTKL